MQVKGYSLPDFLFLSPGKSGTTSIFYYLKKYAPDIYMPSQKELNFFAFRGMEEMKGFSNSVVEDHEYTALFEKKGEYVTGEVSPVYFHFYRNTVKNIAEMYGDKKDSIKFIVVLRNPVDRLWSSYHMFANVWENLPFDLAIREDTIKKRMRKGRLHDIGGGGKAYFLNYIENTQLSPNLHFFMENFKRKQFCFLLFDDFVRNRREFFRSLSHFLEIEDGWVDNLNYINIKKGSTSKIKHPVIYNFLVKRNRVKDVLKKSTIYLHYAEQIKKIKQYIYSSKFFHEDKESLPLAKRKELYFKYYEKDIEDVESLIGVDLSRWKYN